MLTLPVQLLTGGPTMVAAAHPSSFGELVRRAADARPDDLAVIDADVRWSWAELSRTVSSLAVALSELGLATDDRIAIHAPTSAQFVAMYLAALPADLAVV